MIKKLGHDLFSNDYMIFVNEGSNYFAFFSNEMDILSVDLNNINFNDVKFDENDPETIIHVRHIAWRNRYKQRKSCKKDKLMPVAWHPARSWDWCLPEDKKKGIQPIFAKKN